MKLVVKYLPRSNKLEVKYRGVVVRKRYANDATPLENHYETIRRILRLWGISIPANLYPLYLDMFSSVWIIPEEEYDDGKP